MVRDDGGGGGREGGENVVRGCGFGIFSGFLLKLNIRLAHIKSSRDKTVFVKNLSET